MFRDRLNVDDGVVVAFLRIKRFRYAARSMESIVKMSALSGKDMYDQSSVPPLEQLQLHVDAITLFELAKHNWSDIEAGAADARSRTHLPWTR